MRRSAQRPSKVPMAVLHQHAFCPHSRFIRLALGELGLPTDMEEEYPWEREERFLALNPAGTIPVLHEKGIVVPGAGPIAEYLDEAYGVGRNGRRLMPTSPARRVEVRRLLDWFNVKFHDEVTGYLVTEKIVRLYTDPDVAPDHGAVRAATTNLRYHLRYVGHLIAQRNWLAGDTMTYADLAAAAHLSCADYLGDVPWDEDETAKDWYARVKSRPAFRAILADRVPGLAPPDHYEDPDF
jgi:glutathione S-transferase